MILINSSPKDTLRAFQLLLPVWAPIGLASLKAIADREGLPAFLVDEQVERDPLALIGQHVKNLKPPYFFGLSVLTASYRRALDTARQLKSLYPDSVVCFGGPHPTAVPHAVLEHPEVDLVVRGEGEAILPELYRRVKSGSDLDGLAGISFRRGGQVIHGPAPEPILDLDSLPRFPYHYFDPKRYDLSFVASSRGCPYRCIFCSNRNTTGKRYRYRNNDAVMEDLELLQSQYGRRHVGFLDDNLLVNRKRIGHLLAEIRRRGLDKKMSFAFQARGDNVDEELLRELYATNFRSVFYGLESASEELMKVLEKGETVEQCKQAVRLAKKIGFKVSATFLFCIPGETHADRMNCLRMSQELDIDIVRFNNATPYPGTKLFEIAREQGRLHVQGEYENFNSVSIFIENPLRKIPLSYVPPGATETEIRHDILFSYLAYFLNWHRLQKILTKKKASEGMGWSAASGTTLWEIVKSLPGMVWLGLLMGIKFADLALGVLWGRNTKLRFREMWRLIFHPAKPPAPDASA
jgi:radical SAM superfamily enzyme YgiQ (UPF0313 family)